MKNKPIVVSLIVFVTILLIVILKIAIKHDTVQTRNSRLQFFSQNLNFHHNNILKNIESIVPIIFSEFEKDVHFKKIILELTNCKEAEIKNLVDPLLENSLNIYPELAKIGVSCFNLIIKQRDNQNIIIRFNEKDFIKSNNLSIHQVPDNYEKIPTSRFAITNNFMGYHLFFPLYGENNEVKAHLQLCIDYKYIISHLQTIFPEHQLGYLFYSNSQPGIKNKLAHIGFLQSPYNELFILGNKINLIINSLFEEKIFSNFLKNNYRLPQNEKTGHYSTFIRWNQKIVAASLSLEKFQSSDGNLYLVSINNDDILDKTNDLNNQIFLINLIVIILIMFGITYLYINRINLIHQKKSIEESETKLKQINQSKDKFFSILAHDLKNPFNGIMGMSGFLNDNYDEIEDWEKREIINDISNSSKSAFNLLQNLLEWTRAQSGTIRNFPVKIEPESIIQLSLETVHTLAKNKNIEISIEVATKKNGFADENLVSTVLRNLFTNAVKFSPRNSIIEANVKDFQNELIFCIKDNGIGLNTNEIDQLFRIDLNFHKKGTENETGTGLGLKICKEFAEYCNGRIWVISDPGRGSSFYFTIPLLKLS
jgi:signal transduction histidine kinase